MGNWQILIRGSGQHHNASSKDADRIAAATVLQLTTAGHKVKLAIFTVRGQEHNLTPQPSTTNHNQAQPSTT